MKVVIDTSVLFQAMYSSTGVSHEMFRLIRSNYLKIAISIPVFEEYCDVLLRKTSLDQFELDEYAIKKILDFIALIGIKTDISYLLRPNLRDENDNMFVELAFASDARFIITKNVKDFIHNSDLKFDSFEIITPADFMKRWRFEHGEN